MMNHDPVVPNAPPTMSCVTEDCRRDIPVYCDGEGRVLIQQYSVSSPECDTAEGYAWTSDLGQDRGCGYMVEPIVRMLAEEATAITLEMSVEDDGVTNYSGWPTVLGAGWIRTNHTDALEALRNGGHWQTREIAASWEQSEPDKYCFVSEDGAEDKAVTVYGISIENGYVTRWPDMMSAYDMLCFHWSGRPGGQFYGEEGKTEWTEKYSEILQLNSKHSAVLSYPDEMRGLQMSSTWLTMKPGFCCLPQENVETFKNPQCAIETCQTNTSLNEAGDKCCADRAGALTYGNDCEPVQCAVNKQETVAGDCVPCEREGVEEFVDEAGCVAASCVDGYVLMNGGPGDVCVVATAEPTTEPTFAPTNQPTVPLQPTHLSTPGPKVDTPSTEVIIIAQSKATAPVNWFLISVVGGVLVAFTAAIGVAWYRARKNRAHQSAQRLNRPRQRRQETSNTADELFISPSLDTDASSHIPVLSTLLAVPFTGQVQLTTIPYHITGRDTLATVERPSTMLPPDTSLSSQTGTPTGGETSDNSDISVTEYASR